MFSSPDQYGLSAFNPLPHSIPLLSVALGQPWQASISHKKTGSSNVSRVSQK